jgi:hypothetical protein
LTLVDKAKQALPTKAKHPLATFLYGLVLAGLAVLALILFVDIGGDEAESTESDTPPAEYLYLDGERVLAYLGQIEGGLSDKETRNESAVIVQKTALKGGLVEELRAEREKKRTVERVVTPAATDRFFSLLVELRKGKKRPSGDNDSAWLHELDALLTSTNTVPVILDKLKTVEEGDFVRISNAQLFLAPYAAVVPKARYAAGYLGGRISQPPRPLYAPISDTEQKALDKYLAALGADPTLPFVAPTLAEQRGKARNVVTFFVPARYAALADNARLLVGNLTVVGKVVYKDPRLLSSGDCPQPGDRQGIPCRYFDRQALATYGPALEDAPKSVLKTLGLGGLSSIERVVRESVTFDVPILVVLPIAIYQ